MPSNALAGSIVTITITITINTSASASTSVSVYPVKVTIAMMMHAMLTYGLRRSPMRANFQQTPKNLAIVSHAYTRTTGPYAFLSFRVSNRPGTVCRM